ncbi:MAG: DJ-1/PfpI family protein [Candidatus Eremiobacteraeota bacterium]|nr:DJ-1/PfpI family protein [Candidatus Eremiobacteraeota bacterium]
MNRRDLVVASAAAIGMTLGDAPLLAATTTNPLPNRGKLVKPPAHGAVQVAFVVGPDTVLIDVAGPWEAMVDAMVPMHLYTVAPSMDGVDLGGIAARPDHTFANAPQPNVIVIPATRNLPESIAWVKKASTRADITMSICTGAFLLAKTGLLDGQYATTHHGAYDEFERKFPKVKLVRGPRYVENRDVASAGGETSGIDLGLRVVERYFGKAAADASARNMEHVRTKRSMA